MGNKQTKVAWIGFLAITVAALITVAGGFFSQKNNDSGEGAAKHIFNQTIEPGGTGITHTGKGNINIDLGSPSNKKEASN